MWHNMLVYHGETIHANNQLLESQLKEFVFLLLFIVLKIAKHFNLQIPLRGEYLSGDFKK